MFFKKPKELFLRNIFKKLQESFPKRVQNAWKSKGGMSVKVVIPNNDF